MDKRGIYSFLDEHHICYEAYEHPALFSAEELDSIDIPNKGDIVKNLFLCDDKKKNYYLAVVPINKRVNLKNLSKTIGSRKLSFASENKLWELFKLKRGSVTPLGVLNDDNKIVTVIFDSSMKGQNIGIHPMENTATVFIAFDDVLKIVKNHGNSVITCSVTSQQ